MQQEPKYFKGGGSSSTTSSTLDPAIRDAILPVINRASSEYQSGNLERVADTSQAERAYESGITAAQAYQNSLQGLEGDARSMMGLEGAYGEGRENTRALGQEMMQGIGQDNITRDLSNLGGNLQAQASMGGSLTSARQQEATQGALADRALQLRQADMQMKGQGANALMGLGTQAQTAGQQGLQNIQGLKEQGIQAETAKVQAAQGIRGLQQEEYDAPMKAAMAMGSFLAGAPQASDSTTTSSGGK